MSNKLKIGNTQFNLKNYYQSTHNGRPCWVFGLEASRDVIKPLIVDNQSFVIISEVGGETSERDVSNDCILFGSLLEENDGNCVLTMENYSDVELLTMLVNDLLGV